MKKQEFTDITEDTFFIKERIRQLYDLIMYPDITIMLLDSGLGQSRMRGELMLPNGDLLVQEIDFDENMLKDKTFLKHIENKILEKIGAEYIKRSYKKRQTDENITNIREIYYTLKRIISKFVDKEI